MKKYNQIFVDFDGVICNSNELKKQNMHKATSFFLGKEESNAFVLYFTQNNGLPREIKIKNYFKHSKIAMSILKKYNELNKNLYDAPLIPGADKFIYDNRDKEMYVLSGGDKLEISNFLSKNKLLNYFTDILCGPITKEDNLKSIILKQPALFIGDSVHDYKIAKMFKLTFVFMYGETQVLNWQKFDLKDTVLTENFLTLKWESL